MFIFCFGRLLGLSRFPEKLRINGKVHLNGPTDDLAGRRPDTVAKGILQPILEEQIGHAHGERFFAERKFCISVKPKVEAWLPDALSDILAQRRHDFIVARRQGSLPGARFSYFGMLMPRPESPFSSSVGKPKLESPYSEKRDCRWR